MNRVILSGHVGQDPEIKNFENGSVANFTLATTKRGFTTADGKTIEPKTTWHNCVVKSKGLVNVVGKYVHKGDSLLLEGEITNRKYEANGQTRYVTEILVDEVELQPKKESNDNPF